MEGSAGGGKPGTGRRWRILVADDEQSIRTVVARALRSTGFEVVEASDGWEAFDLLKADPGLGVLITDLWMPRMNGAELVEAAASLGSPPVVIVLSGHVAPATAERLGRLGVTRIMSKPVDLSELLDMVNDAIAERHQRTSPAGPSEASALPMVVVADDDFEVRRMLSVLLSCHGFQVVEACDGEDAVKKVLERGASLAIVDLSMPRKSGVEAVVAIRKASRDCLVICTTGECGRREMDAAVGAGAVRCFRKPLDMEELVAEIRRLSAVADHRKAAAGRAGGRPPGILARLRARRTRRLALAAVVVTIVGAILVPVVSRCVAAARASASSAGARLDAALDTAARVEGYLQRDEQRELRDR